jgi:hypothetical protein
LREPNSLPFLLIAIYQALLTPRDAISFLDAPVSRPFNPN